MTDGAENASPGLPDADAEAREAEAARVLRDWPGRTLVVSHLRPDGDAVGSAFGLAICMRAAGMDAACVGVGPVSEIYDFLLDGAPPRFDAPPPPLPGDRLVVVDAGEPSRLPEAVRTLADGRLPTVCIDHHERSGGFPGAFSLVEPDAGSASEIAFRVAEKAGFPVPRAAADAFWTGVLTDTGRFGYDSTSEKTMLAAARLVALGARVQLVSERVYGRVPLRRLRLQKRFLDNLGTSADGRVAVGFLSPEDYAAEGCDSSDSENFVDIARSVSGCLYAAFVRRVSPEKPVNVSLRAAPPRDVAAICAEWGGGGHRAAAGATLSMPLPEAVGKVRARLELAAAGRDGAQVPVSSSDAPGVS